MRKKQKLTERVLESGLAGSLHEAEALILAGNIIVDGQRVDKPGAMVPTAAAIRGKKRRLFASRGGEKLAHAIVDLDLAHAFQGKAVLDIGASTGGFTDCVLKHGATTVIALDVGTNQLAWQLRSDSRVMVLDRTDIRDFDPGAWPAVSWILADISFNSLTRLSSTLKRIASYSNARLLLLAKPQFEAKRSEVPEGGVIVDAAVQKRILQDVAAALVAESFVVEKIIPGRPRGRRGNQEYFLLVSLN